MKNYSHKDIGRCASSTSAGQSDIPAGYAEKHPEIARLMGWFMLRHLGRLYHEFKGDLVLPIVLGEIAHHNIHRYFSFPMSQATDKLADRPGTISHNDLEPCNAFSLSEATGIPRETVRRKIAILLSRGWLTKHANGGYVITPAVAEQFACGINLQTLNDFLLTSQELRRVLERQSEQVQEA